MSNNNLLAVQNQASGQLVALVNGKPTTTSNVIAVTFGKRHDAVLRSIRNLDCSPDFHAHNFVEMFTGTEIGNGAIRKDPAYEVTRDGFSFLAMGFTGKEAAKWKEAYINAFNLMESEIRRIQYSSNPTDALTAGQAEQLRVALRMHGDKLPKEQQGAFMAKGWAKLKSHFGVTYRKIPQFELGEALSLIARHTTEWELVDTNGRPASEKKCMDETLRHNIGALANHMLWLRGWWAAHEPGIRAMNGETAYTIHDHFIDGVCIARNVARAIGQVLPEEYIKNYPWRADSSDRQQYHKNA